MRSDYKVGYQKTPEHTRFKKGTSGYPKGRPKGTRNLKTDLREEMNEKILLREGDRPVKITKQRAIIKSMVAKTLKGDPRAAVVILNLVSTLFGLDQDDVEANRPLRDEELELLAGIEQRLLSGIKVSER